nr:MAG TPA: tail fiber protein [Caudoviricetes sp.]
MALSWSEEVVPAGTTLIPVNIEYLDKSYIYVYINNVLLDSDNYSWNSDVLIQLNQPLSATSTVLLVRRTDKTQLYIMFAEGAAFIKENLDTQNTQFLHLAQELVEGRSIDGFYGDISMNGYRITNLGDGVNPGDAVNKKQLDEVDQRVANIEGSFVTSTTSYPFFELVETTKDTFSPPFVFDKAAVYINGLCQVPGYSYVVVDNQILLAEPVPAGTEFLARLGEDVTDEDGYATVQQMLNFAAQFNADLELKAAKGANSDITSLSGLTTPLSVEQGGTGNNTGKAPAADEADAAVKLKTVRTIRINLASTTASDFDGTANVTPGVTGTLPIANGGTGNTTGNAATATKLATARTLQTNLGSTSGASFDGSANASPGVTGTLGVGNGGTGATTAAAARTNLGAASDTGVTDASNAAAGKVGQYMSNQTASGVALTSGSSVNVTSITLTPGDWEVDGSVFVNVVGGNITTAVSGTGTASPTSIEGFPHRTQLILNFGGDITFPIPRRRFNVTANTTVYMAILASFTGTATGGGFLQARRIR